MGPLSVVVPPTYGSHTARTAAGQDTLAGWLALDGQRITESGRS